MIGMISKSRRRSEDVDGAPPRFNIVAVAILLGSLAIAGAAAALTRMPVLAVVIALVGLTLMQSPRVAQQWERAVVLRLGRFIGLNGPGLFWVVPFIDRVSSWIDQRTITTSLRGRERIEVELQKLIDQRIPDQYR